MASSSHQSPMSSSEMAASNPNQMEAAQAQVQEVVGVMRNNIDKVIYSFERKNLHFRGKKFSSDNFESADLM